MVILLQYNYSFKNKTRNTTNQKKVLSNCSNLNIIISERACDQLVCSASVAPSRGGGPRFDPLWGPISMDFPGFIPGLRWPSTHAGNWCPRPSLQGRRVSVSIGCVVLSLRIGGVCECGVCGSMCKFRCYNLYLK